MKWVRKVISLIGRKISKNFWDLMCRRRRQAGALSSARSYPTSEVRDSGPECQAAMAQERPGGATPRWGQWQPGGDTPRPRSGRRPGGATQHPRPVAASRRHPMSEVRASDPKEPPRAPGQGRWQGGATWGVVAEQAQEGLEELSNIEGQEQWQ